MVIEQVYPDLPGKKGYKCVVCSETFLKITRNITEHIFSLDIQRHVLQWRNLHLFCFSIK